MGLVGAHPRLWTPRGRISRACAQDLDAEPDGGKEAGYGYAWFDEEKGIKVPLRPFAGEMGVAPGKDGAHSTIPPYATGGNVDTRHLSAGSTLFLPVEVEGALFSIGVSVGG